MLLCAVAQKYKDFLGFYSPHPSSLENCNLCLCALRSTVTFCCKLRPQSAHFLAPCTWAFLDVPSAESHILLRDMGATCNVTTVERPRHRGRVCTQQSSNSRPSDARNAPRCPRNRAKCAVSGCLFQWFAFPFHMSRFPCYIFNS